ncbi:hypothetical protein [Sulfurisphaera tokodaii]|uniref:Uncharacterized protein n=2 Tax=Sulfurisphaera tokodaii TaxID=111955 RepID=F9VMM6_SULTO|nr:hypothetical protein [Sulfurisphaera tokodaii]BAK54172.1 hypothetical protein STK_01735 [Sulfurisphaera tokodaii str. 7]HII74287.1 hypothetical protein [Sulfurisphaera tokodaii]
MNKDELKKVIIDLLSKEGPKTSTEIRDILIEKGYEFDMIKFREALAELVREGKVKKEASYERKKLLFYVTAD